MFRIKIVDMVAGGELELTDLTNNGLIDLKSQLEEMLEEVESKIQMEGKDE